MFHTKVAEKIKTHILCSVTVSENRDVYKIKRKSTVQPDRHAGYLRLQTHYTEYVILVILCGKNGYANASQR